jgi:hypothetical protein
MVKRPDRQALISRKTLNFGPAGTGTGGGLCHLVSAEWASPCGGGMASICWRALSTI